MKKKVIQYPVELVLSLLGDKWSLLIICKLKKCTLRFNELQKQLGTISTKVLTDKLQNLETNGFIKRKVYPEVPPKVEYSLTALGYSLDPILESMFDWGMEHQSKFSSKYDMSIDPHLSYPKRML